MFIRCGGGGFGVRENQGVDSIFNKYLRVAHFNSCTWLQGLAVLGRRGSGASQDSGLGCSVGRGARKEALDSGLHG